MTISFITLGSIDLEAAFTFGISAKSSETPIGFFGTGLKYAVATLLRTGHRIKILVNGHIHEMNTQDRQHRGKDFKIVYLDDKPLGFTTELGKLWEPWMAFRELYSNTMDENGNIINHHLWDLPEPVAEQDTAIMVSGPAIEYAFLRKHEIFCDSTVVDENEDLKIRHGSSFYLFYRGIRAYKKEFQSIFTYDLQKAQTLTEDRTFLSEWSAIYDIKHAIVKLTDKSALCKILRAPEGTLEHKMDFENISNPSAEFLQVIRELFYDEFLNKSARKLGLKHLDLADAEIELDQIQKQQLDKAISFLMKIGFNVTRYPIKIRELHGILAQAKDGTIFLSPKLFRMGTKYVALGLFEEFLHLSEGCYDETRQMQTILFETIISLGEKIVGEPI